MKYLLGFFALILFVTLPQESYGLSAPITSPEFGYQSGISEEQKEKINRLLEFMNEELEFVAGMFINEFSHQNYNGTSEKVGEFLLKIREASPEPVTVHFRELPREIAFRLNQVSTKATVTVNISRDDFRLKDFRAFLSAEKPKPIEKDTTLEFLQSLRIDFKGGEDAEKIGRQLAEKDLKNNRARVFHVGKPWSSGKPLIDDESGLKVVIAGGCTGGAGVHSVVSGYNSAMRERAAKKGKK